MMLQLPLLFVVLLVLVLVLAVGPDVYEVVHDDRLCFEGPVDVVRELLRRLGIGHIQCKGIPQVVYVFFLEECQNTRKEN